MEPNPIPRIINLIAYLTNPCSHTAQQLADMLGVSRRNVYNYLHTLDGCGFHIIREGSRYRLDPQSAFFKRIHENIPLSDTEAEYICHTLAEANSTDTMAARLRTKLVRHFGLDDLVADPQSVQRVNDTKATLRQAMRMERIVKICDYSSPHSHTISDRYVEPFLFMSGGHDVRCYEITTHQNKTFKLSRMGGVEILADSWFNKASHRQMYTDIFMFSGEERHTVNLRLGQLSRNLMVEEYPLAEPFITPCGDARHWMLTTDVVSFLGIGRFVMGLYDDIDIIGGDDFRQYIDAKLRAMALHAKP